MTTATESGSVGLSHVFLSPVEVAAAIPGITKNTLAMWRYEGKGPRYRKLGRVVVYALDELEAWIESGVREELPSPCVGGAPKDNPVYQHDEIQYVLANGVRWAAACGAPELPSVSNNALDWYQS